jgi:hypothetical protein
VDSFGTGANVVFITIAPANQEKVKDYLSKSHFGYAVVAGQQEWLTL